MLLFSIFSQSSLSCVLHPVSRWQCYDRFTRDRQCVLSVYIYPCTRRHAGTAAADVSPMASYGCFFGIANGHSADLGHGLALQATLVALHHSLASTASCLSSSIPLRFQTPQKAKKHSLKPNQTLLNFASVRRAKNR